MKDEFLSQFRKAPRPEFSVGLYARLKQEEHTMDAGVHVIVRRLSLSLAAILLAFVMALGVSPSVRADMEAFLAKIKMRGMTVIVDEPRPIMSGEGESYSVIWKPVTPKQIALEYPFFDKQMEWTPRGYELQEQAGLFYGSFFQEMPSSVVVQWQDQAGGAIQLEVTKGSCPNGPPEETTESIGGDCTMLSYFAVGLEAEPKVMAVNQQPAMLFRGVWGFTEIYETNREWNPSRGKWNTDPNEGYSLYWENDGRTYGLVAWSKGVSEKDMIRMAESIP